MKFTTLCWEIFPAVIEDYHRYDNVDQPIANPYQDGSIEYLLYLKNWIDTVQWHLEDLIRDPQIDPVAALELKRRIDRSNQERTDMVEYIDDQRNPTGINKYCRDYALTHGHLNFKKGKRKDPITDEIIDADVVDNDNPYTPDDPEERRIIIIDNASNLSLESGLKKMETIDKMSKYGITLRNQLKFIFVLIQHQAQAQEGIENQKLNKLKPSSDGLADCKTTTRDANMVIGLYSPFKYGLREYEGYDITKFRNHIRFMEVIEDRDYGANGQICPLFFDGAVSTFYELPRPDDKEALQRVYNYMESRKSKTAKTFFSYGINKMNRKLHRWKIFHKFATLFK